MWEGHECGRPPMGPKVTTTIGEDEDVESTTRAHRSEAPANEQGRLHRKGKGRMWEGHWRGRLSMGPNVTTTIGEDETGSRPPELTGRKPMNE